MDEREKSDSGYEETQRILREEASRYEDDFLVAKSSWEENCQGVDEILEEYAREVNGKIEKWREDTPSRALIWKKEPWYPLGFSISMLLETKETPLLKIYAASWIDDNKGFKRYSMQLEPFEAEVPTSREFISDVIKTYGHVLRIFSGGTENQSLVEEITNLKGPVNIGIHFSQSDLSH